MVETDLGKSLFFKMIARSEREAFLLEVIFKRYLKEAEIEERRRRGEGKSPSVSSIEVIRTSYRLFLL
ncbi:hypothetical protein DC080_09590 [Ignatzschineria cameli]|nr:hypothetical protein DC080_09590 [Ignatzschineria cameli]